MIELRRSGEWMRSTFLVTAVASCLIGCGGAGTDQPPTHQVNGVVHYNGEPLPNVAVTFYPANGRSAVGKTDAQGKFSLMSFAPNDGAIAGEHKVVVVPAPEAGATQEGSELTTDDYAPPSESEAASFPNKYRAPETTDLTVRIPEDLKDGSITLELTD